ncbi:hypothetical protein [Embleya sp. NPDC001921]
MTSVHPFFSRARGNTALRPMFRDFTEAAGSDRRGGAVPTAERLEIQMVLFDLLLPMDDPKPKPPPAPTYIVPPDTVKNLPPAPGGNAPFAGPLNDIIGIAFYLTLTACVVGFLLSAAKLAMTYRNGDAEGTIFGAGWVMVACALAGSSVSIAKAVVF